MSQDIVLIQLILSPVVSAAGADKDEVHPVLGRVGEGHCLRVPTVLARLASSSGETRVLDALSVNKQLVLHLALLTLVDAVVSLITMLSSLEVSTDAAVIDKGSLALISDLFLRLEHVVTLSAKAHAFKSHH